MGVVQPQVCLAAVKAMVSARRVTPTDREQHVVGSPAFRSNRSRAPSPESNGHALGHTRVRTAMTRPSGAVIATQIGASPPGPSLLHPAGRTGRSDGGRGGERGRMLPTTPQAAAGRVRGVPGHRHTREPTSGSEQPALCPMLIVAFLFSHRSCCRYCGDERGIRKTSLGGQADEVIGWEGEGSWAARARPPFQ